MWENRPRAVAGVAGVNLGDRWHHILGARCHPWRDVDVADKPGFCLRKLIVMFYCGRSGFKREFLEINRIHIYGFKHSVRASPKNEGFREVIPAVLRVPSIAEKMVPSNERIYTRRPRAAPAAPRTSPRSA